MTLGQVLIIAAVCTIAASGAGCAIVSLGYLDLDDTRAHLAAFVAIAVVYGYIAVCLFQAWEEVLWCEGPPHHDWHDHPAGVDPNE